MGCLGVVGLVFLAWFVFRKKKVNPYVQFHKLKVRNDNNYKDYLKWCLSLGEIPMDKYDYIKEITDKEKQIDSALK